VFFGYIISSSGIKVDEEKIKAIKDWLKLLFHFIGDL